MSEDLDEIIEKLKRNGSTFNSDVLKQIKEEVIKSLKKDESISEILIELTKELEEKINEFINHTNRVISGLATCIYIPNLDGSYSITVYGGKNGYDKNDYDIDEKTIFDLASITKLYTFLLALKLIENGYLRREDEISKLDERFSSLKNYTVEDVLKMSGVIKTKGLIISGKDKEEAMNILKTTYIEDEDKTKNNYTDLGFIILSKVIEQIVSSKCGKVMSFNEIMNEYLLKPWGLNETMFYPSKNFFHIAGNGNSDGTVHDPKAKILGGSVGSAGLFATSHDLKCLSDHLFKVENVNYAKLAGSVIFSNSNKGYAGIYQKHPLGLEKSFVPNEYAKGSFASQGFTGSVAIFDIQNKIHNHILVNSIKEGEIKKPEGYMNALTIYQIILTQITLKMYLSTKYYQNIGYSEFVDIYGRAK